MPFLTSISKEDFSEFILLSTCYFTKSSTVRTSCYFLDRMKTLIVLSDVPAAITAPLSERVTQFIYLYVLSSVIEPIVGRLLLRLILAVSYFSIFCDRTESS